MLIYFYTHNDCTGVLAVIVKHCMCCLSSERELSFFWSLTWCLVICLRWSSSSARECSSCESTSNHELSSLLFLLDKDHHHMFLSPAAMRTQVVSTAPLSTSCPKCLLTSYQTASSPSSSFLPSRTS